MRTQTVATVHQVTKTHQLAANFCYLVYKNQDDYLLARDGEYTYIAIKGTNETGDWLTNFRFLFDSSDTHRGFSNYAKGIYDKIQDLANPKERAQELYEEIKSLLNPKNKYIVTGHSLGGASATILGIWLEEDGYDIAECVTFGSPRPGGRKLKKRYSSLKQVHHRYIHSDDSVVHVPPFMFGYVHVCNGINLKDMNGEKLMDVVSDHDMKAYMECLGGEFECDHLVFKER